MELPGALFKPKFEKWKNPPRKQILLFREMELFCCIIKKSLTFSYISGNAPTHPPPPPHPPSPRKKKFFIFQETETLKSFLYFGKWNFSAQVRKIKKSTTTKWNFLALILKKILLFSQKKGFLYFEKRTPKKIPYISGNGTFLYFRKKLFKLEK